ncbi:MAG: family acetyltransferase [Burkholderiales bacterium]|jgi:ribosomal protein S18 acetylase RimI-like enzyme|nr:family acetyltransferase [Burkholderiales bacterium]
MDMLIKLYDIPAPAGELEGFLVRRPLGAENVRVVETVQRVFGAAWSSEAQAALSNRPITLFIAQQANDIQGFCCYDATARGLVGPIGVIDSARGRGIGAALLLACLHDMRTMGYGYAIAGHVGAPEFFRRVAGAIEIPDSTPGLYAHLLR